MNTPNNQSSLDSWIDWLLNLHAQEIDLGLERIRVVAEQMQLKRPAPLVVSVAGTNGKGSSVAMLSSIYEKAGYKVGTYTSPHIISFTERVKINSIPVEEQQIVDAFDLIEQQRGATKLTYFEFSTLAALQVFKQTDLDIVILEVGLGGRLDAVNVVDADAALITAIDIDHIDWLGDDRNQIALEKAGIMRKGAIAVCSDAEVPQTLVDYANNLGTELSLLGRDYRYFPLQSKTQNGWCLQTELSAQTIEMPVPALKGEFQLQNAAGVVQLVARLAKSYPVSQQALDLGLENVSHAGRLELRQIQDQQWLIDVAHNPQSAKVLAEYLEQQAGQKYVALFSALSDKDMLPMVQQIKPYVSEWLIADLAIPRSTPIAELKQILISAGITPESIEECSTMSAAVEQTLKSSQKQVLVWGSFFTVAQTIAALESSQTE